MMTLSEPAAPFFVAGGTVPPSSGSYVERQADSQLRDALLRSEYCYVLHSRQMGKSSLMARAAAAVREHNTRVAIIDLTILGRNLTVDQWYYGLLQEIGRQLGMQSELREFWKASSDLGPLRRWMAAIDEVVLPALRDSARYGPMPSLVIFIDEIDSILSLPFQTGEFLAALREFYNRRSEEPLLKKLTFCLLGVASPSELIHDERMAPFNIGRRIELTDFERNDMNCLAPGLQPASALASANVQEQVRRVLDRIYYWTGGHPYLTQRLCQQLAESGEAATPALVDRSCHEVFIREGEALRDDNLIFVQDYILHDADRRIELLGAYEAVLRRGSLAMDPEAPLAQTLRLSGVVRAERGALLPRNRIYTTVFNRAWIDRHLPEPELRRQRTRWKKMFWTSVVSGVLGIALFGSLATAAVWYAARAQRAERRAAQLAEERLAALNEAREHRYVANISGASQALKAKEYRAAQTFLERELPGLGEEDRRGPEWSLLWRQVSPAKDLSSSPLVVQSVAFTRRGEAVVVTADAVTVHDARSEELLKSFERRAVDAAGAVEPATGTFVWGDDDSPELTQLDLRTGATLRIRVPGLKRASRLRQAGPGYLSLFQGPGESARLLLYDVRGKRFLPGPEKRFSQPLRVHQPSGQCVSLGADGRLAVDSLKDGRSISSKRWRASSLRQLEISEDGRRVAAAAGEYCALFALPGLALLGEIRTTGKRFGDLALDRSGQAVAFSEATLPGMHDARIHLWIPADGRAPQIIDRRDDWVSSVAIAENGETVLAGGWDKIARLTRVDRRPAQPLAASQPGGLRAIVRASGGRRLMLFSNGWLEEHQGGSSRRIRLPGKMTSLSESSGDGLVAAFRDDLIWAGDQATLEQKCLIRARPGERVMRVVLGPSNTAIAALLFTDKGPSIIRRYNGDGSSRGEAIVEGATDIIGLQARGLMAVVYSDRISLLDESGREVEELRGGGVVGGTASDDGRFLVVPSADRSTAVVHDLETSRPRKSVPLGSRLVIRAAFTEDGERLMLLSTSPDRITFWHTGTLTALCDVPTGKLVADVISDWKKGQLWLRFVDGSMALLPLTSDRRSVRAVNDSSTYR